MLQHLFVYGTLRRAQDGSPHPFLRSQTRYMGQATMQGKLFHVASYPGAIIATAAKDQRVLGELYRLLRPAETLKNLDEYEECSERFPEPREYQRTQQRVFLKSGESVQAWVYLYRHPTTTLRRIDNGDYFAFLPASHARV